MTIYNIVEAIWVFFRRIIILVMLHSPKEMELERLEDRLSYLAAPRVQNQLEPSHGLTVIFLGLTVVLSANWLGQ